MYNTGDITDDGSIYIDREHYRTFKDGIIRTLIDDTNRDSILIPTDQLDDSEAEALSTAVRIISGTMDVTEDMMKDLDFLLSMIYISRYMDSRKLLQIISSSLVVNNHMELLFWFTISKLDDNIWDDLTGKSISLDYVDNSGEYRTLSYGYYYNIPSDSESFFALFGVNVYNMGEYMRDMYGFNSEKYNSLYFASGWENIEGVGMICGPRTITIPDDIESSSDIMKIVADKHRDLEIDYIVMEGVYWMTEKEFSEGGFVDLGVILWIGGQYYTNEYKITLLNSGKYLDFKRKYLKPLIPFTFVLAVDNMDSVWKVLDKITTDMYIGSVDYQKEGKIVNIDFSDG